MTGRGYAFTGLAVLAVGLGLAAAFYFGMQAEQRGLGNVLSIPGAKDASTGQSLATKNVDPTKPGTPAATQLHLLTQSYMLALGQANLTGNYSVLHAMGAPAFQENNPLPKLAQIFSGLRQQNVDLTPLILYKPILTREPWFDGKGMLRLTGYYPTKPKRIFFDLTLEPVSGVWRLFGLSVNAVPAETAAQP